MFKWGKKEEQVSKPVSSTPVSYFERMRNRIISSVGFKNEDPYSNIVEAETIMRIVNQFAENAREKNESDNLNIKRWKSAVELQKQHFMEAYESGDETSAISYQFKIEEAQNALGIAENTFLRSSSTRRIFSKIQPALTDLASYKDWKAIVDIFPKDIFDNINQNLDAVVDNIIDALEKWHDEILIAVERQKELLRRIAGIEGIHEQGKKRLTETDTKVQPNIHDLYKSFKNEEKPKAVTSPVKHAPTVDVVVSAKPTINT